MTMFTFYYLLSILIAILSVSLVLCFIRLYLGPNVPNRTVAFDAIAIHAVGILALFSIRNNSPALLDVAIVTAVLGFLGTTMLARYLERSGSAGWQEENPPRTGRKRP
jgi:multisubunit Na+/H+ antiporter MnhF subunit